MNEKVTISDLPPLPEGASGRVVYQCWPSGPREIEATQRGVRILRPNHVKIADSRWPDGWTGRKKRGQV